MIVFSNQKLVLCHLYGGIAQLGERLNGIQEVSGSIPLISTRKKTRESLGTVRFQGFFLFSGMVLKKACTNDTRIKNGYAVTGG